MEVVVHNGVAYKKAAAAAKEFGYTTDYIGQLCRAEKVDARLVGRAWYVNIESLREHKKGRYNTDFKDRLEEADATDEPEKEYLKRVEVAPVLKNKTVRVTRHYKGEYYEVPVRYEADDGSLIPHVVKEADPVRVPVDLAGATELKIKKPRGKKSSATILRPEPLPEVVLRGKVPIAAVSTPDDTEKDEAKTAEETAETESATTKDLPERRSKTLKVRAPKRRSSHKNKAISAKRDYRFRGKSTLRTHQAETGAANSTEALVISENDSRQSFRPRSMQKREPAVQSERPATTQFGKHTLGLVVLLLTIVAVGLLTLRSDATVLDGEARQTWTFDFSIFTQLLE